MTIQQITELKGASSLPGNFGLPLLGDTFGLFAGEELFYWEKFRRHGSIFKTSVLGRKYAFLIGPEANSIVFKEQADCFSSRLGWWFLEPIFGNGLLMQDGAEHASARRLMYPANLISWVLFELASHPEWINKLRQELLPSRDKITYDV